MRARSVPLVLLALALASCGGDNSEGDDGERRAGGTATGHGVTKAELIERADALCAQFDERIEPIERKSEKTSDPGRQAMLIEQVTDEADRLLDSFDRLEKPAGGDRAALREYLKVSREQVGLARRAGEALEEGDTRRAGALLESGQETAARLSGIAKGYGFKVCSIDD